MSLDRLATALASDESTRRALGLAASGELQVDIAVASGARPVLIAALAGAGASAPGGSAAGASAAGESAASASASVAAPLLIVAATGREAEDLTTALRAFLPAAEVAHLPSWETLPHERLSPRSDTVGRRLAVLRRLAHPDPSDPAYGPIRVLVAPVRALLQPLATGLGELVPVALRPGDERDLDDVVRALAGAAYVRTDLVERRGEFAVRGGILDVFPPTEDHPIRVEFFGDTVEEIRTFRVADQRSLQAAPHGLWAPPCREILLTDAVRARAAELAGTLPGVADLLGKIAAGVAVEGMESLTPVLVDGMESLLDVLPRGSRVVLSDPERVRARAHDLVATSEEFLAASWSGAAAGAAVPIDLQTVLGEGSFWTVARAREHALGLGLPWWTLTPFAADDSLGAFADGGEDALTVTVKSQDLEGYRGDGEAIRAALRRWAVEEGRRVAVVTEGGGLGKRIAEVLAEQGVPCRLAPDGLGADFLGPGGTVHITTGCLPRGFTAPGADLVVITEGDLIGQGATGGAGSTRDMRKMPSRRRNQVDPLQLRPGDFVVHEQHGVGRFVEMTQRTVQGATREYLVLEYAASKRGQPGDRLFVPTDQLDQVTRYVGGEAPALNKLGGSDWAKTKSRAKRHVKQIAGELIRLYSARMATRGHAFAPDTPWQRELEDAFAYVETPDQLSSIDEVKVDMEKEVPMDRLICGDVGFGKTEVAMRAAFFAVQSRKQVAVLAPTTVLAFQHYETFKKRFEGWPVDIRVLNRFVSPADSKKAVQDTKDGKVDILIGTHRLFSKEIGFKDLGLLIIDEEQKFGVAHKEKIRKLKVSVDTLTLSATPIPRTLNMSFVGVRDLSIINTPPVDRLPTRTFVSKWEGETIRKSIASEITRGGQVYFIHNRVQSIYGVADEIRQLIPEARVKVAHGQMDEDELENTMLAFFHHEIDVLVCTAIVESGMDVSRANTMFIDRADMFGLSQLYQLRGRVGRSKLRAYCYLILPKDRKLDKDAQERLRVIQENTALGSGIRIAQYDLELRGSGTILGEEQSGHIDAVGYELYMDLLNEALAEAKGEDISDAELDPEINLRIPAMIPDSYVNDVRIRLGYYKALAEVSNEDELARIGDELRDQFGELPEPVLNLMGLMMIRRLCKDLGIRDVGAGVKTVSLVFTEKTPLKPEVVIKLAMRENKKYAITPDNRLNIRMNTMTWTAVYEELRLLLKLI